MTRFMETMHMWLSPRRRAERLIQARLDARRGEGGVDPADDAWLERRLAADRALQLYLAEQEALQAFLRPAEAVRAPEGFAARVVKAAQARPRDSLPPLDGRAGLRRGEDRWGPWVWATGAAVVAATVGGIMLRVPETPGPIPAGRLEVSGPAAPTASQPDFEVRAPGVGAAQARALIVALLQRRGGQPTDDGAGALQVRIPRKDLVPVMRDLAKSGTFKVTPMRAEPLAPEVQTVVLRFVLD